MLALALAGSVSHELVILAVTPHLDLYIFAVEGLNCISPKEEPSKLTCLTSQADSFIIMDFIRLAPLAIPVLPAY